MKKPPEGWPRISSCLFYDDAAAAIDWLCRAFGFEVRLKVEDGEGGIVHSELLFGEAVIMVGSASAQRHFQSPRSLGGANTQCLFGYVDDVDAHCERARKAGATIVSEPVDKNHGDDWGTDRGYGALDCEGHSWWFAQRLVSPSKH